MSDPRALLLSVKPKYAEMLIDGVKTVELRRVPPRVDHGVPVLIYASTPRKAMVGVARVGAVEVGAVEAIWARYALEVGIDARDYDAYFDGASRAVAIGLYEVQRLQRSVPLDELRRRLAGFRPPQSFMYLGAADALALSTSGLSGNGR